MQIDGKIMDDLDITSINILANCKGRNSTTLMITVQQGMIDGDLHRTTISHCIAATDIESAIPKILARAKAVQGIKELLSVSSQPEQSNIR